MGYPQFNKVTIQLPLPTTTMTKAEYKATYGIDLDAIDFPKVSLLVDGDNKYHVDEIKIVSDDVLILAGGKILTIGDNGNVSVTTNAYSVDNSKPIYFHPVYYARDNADYTQRIRASYFILNNDPTPFTYSTFIAYIKKLMDAGAVIQVNGCITETGEETKNLFIVTKPVNDYRIVWNTSSAVGDASLDDFTIEASFIDGVNKIN